MSADIFGNYDVPYVEEGCVTRSEQCNVWRRIISIRTDLSTERRTGTSWRRRRKKRFDRTCTYREYGLVCLRKCISEDECFRCQEVDVLNEKFGSSGLYQFSLCSKVELFRAVRKINLPGLSLSTGINCIEHPKFDILLKVPGGELARANKGELDLL